MHKTSLHCSQHSTHSCFVVLLSDRSCVTIKIMAKSGFPKIRSEQGSKFRIFFNCESEANANFFKIFSAKRSECEIFFVSAKRSESENFSKIAKKKRKFFENCEKKAKFLNVYNFQPYTSPFCFAARSSRFYRAGDKAESQKLAR